MPEYKVETTAKGYKFLSIGVAEIKAMGGIGICDSCSKYTPQGKYIAVLNSYYCEKCFIDFQSIKYYPEDVPIETRRLNSRLEYLNSLNLK